ncbi:hypothetical protein Mapa_017826 [Marchantia paleacea]|nr:hypothetical protein Mapa_017826 [Marchantia paleacea]
MGSLVCVSCWTVGVWWRNASASRVGSGPSPVLVHFQVLKVICYAASFTTRPL